jgi:signal recognition particle subunit SRP54
MIPGIGSALREQNVEISDDAYKQVEAIIRSMTPEERRNPSLIRHARRNRIATGSGTSPDEVVDLLKQFREMQKMMSQLGGLAGGEMPGGKKGKRGVMSRMPGQIGQIGQMRDMMKQMQESGMDPSQLGGMGGLPGMGGDPRELEALMSGQQQLGPMQQRGRRAQKGPSHTKPQRSSGAKRKKKR